MRQSGCCLSLPGRAAHVGGDAASDGAHHRELELLREMLEQERSAHARTRIDYERERRSWDEERTFMRGLVDKQAEQMRMITDQRERPSPSLWARLWRRTS